MDMAEAVRRCIATLDGDRFLYFSGPNEGKRFCFQRNASIITSPEYAKLEAIELPHLDPSVKS